ncbi:MAG: PIN domain-containing protein, partial [Thermoleophilia bacterium]|nr:PIN domain-containing protein [Thermoleophilia bacterium]
MMVILDTDVMIDLLRGHPPAVAWLESLGDTEVCLPGFVAMELIQGCRNRQEQRKLKKQISRYAVLWPKPEDCQTALSVFA